MRPIERVAVVSGIFAAILIALSSQSGGSAAIAGNTTEPMRVGTVDVYLIMEKLMESPDLKKARDDLAATYQARASAIEKELLALQDDLKVLPQNSPQAKEILDKAEAKQADYQNVVQERGQELERMNSGQLIKTYNMVREATATVNQQLKYTHIISNRVMDKPIITVNVAATLQELLARPIVVGNPADDITNAVLTELKLQP